MRKNSTIEFLIDSKPSPTSRLHGVVTADIFFLWARRVPSVVQVWEKVSAIAAQDGSSLESPRPFFNLTLHYRTHFYRVQCHEPRSMLALGARFLWHGHGKGQHDSNGDQTRQTKHNRPTCQFCFDPQLKVLCSTTCSIRIRSLFTCGRSFPSWIPTATVRRSS